MSVVRTHDAFSLDSARRRFLFKDDFLGDQLQDLWRETGAGSATITDAQTGGIVRILTGALNTNAYQLDWNDARSLLVSKKVIMECRVKLSQTTNQLVYLMLYNSGNDRIGFEHNTASTANWGIRSRAGGTGALQNTGVAPDTDEHIFRVECFPTGEIHFYIDDVETNNSPITTNLTALYLQPILFMQTTEDVAHSMDVDYVIISQER